MSFNPKSVIVLLIASSYVGLTAYAVIVGHAVAGVLVTGFTLFAQKIINEFFTGKPDPDPLAPNSIAPGTGSQIQTNINTKP